MNELVDIAIGLFMPLLISWLKSNKMPDALNVGLSLLACIAVAAVKTLIAAHLMGETITFDMLLSSIGIIMTAATLVYKAWFQNTALNEKLEQKKVLP